MCRGGTQPARGRDRASRGVGLPSRLLPGPPSSLTAGFWATGDTFAQRRSEEEAPVPSHVLPLPIWSSRPPRPRHGEDAQVRGAPRPGSGQFPGSRLVQEVHRPTHSPPPCAQSRRPALGRASCFPAHLAAGWVLEAFRTRRALGWALLGPQESTSCSGPRGATSNLAWRPVHKWGHLKS